MSRVFRRSVASVYVHDIHKVDELAKGKKMEALLRTPKA